MSEEDEICPDFHVCRNGSNCVESTIREGSFYCDCDQPEEDALYAAAAGLSCEHEATVYCNEFNKKSYTSFCTNEGTCKVKDGGVNSAHQGCDCPSPYTGDFCEFLMGQKIPEHMGNSPPVESASSITNTSEKSLTGVVAFLFVFVFVSAILVLYCCLRIRNMNNKHQEDPSSSTLTKPRKGGPGMNLEADGSVLQEAMQARRVPSPPPTPEAVRVEEDDNDEEMGSGTTNDSNGGVGEPLDSSPSRCATTTGDAGNLEDPENNPKIV